MNIGSAASQSGLSAKAIRYYEDIGLVCPGRYDNGYRNYGTTDVRKLSFLRRARTLGFTIDECRKLLALFETKNRSNRKLLVIAEAGIGEAERKIDELSAMKKVLMYLIEHCESEDRPDCPIFDDLPEKRKTKAKTLQ